MRPFLRYLSAAVSVLALAACGETSAPTSASSTHQLAASSPAFDYSQTGFLFGQRSADFTITSSAQHVNVDGLFSLDIPANVCPMLEGSTSCAQSVKVHAVTQITSSGIVVDFSPHVTFTGPVKLSTGIFAPLILANRSYFAAHPSTLDPLVIVYSPSLTSAPVPDYANNPLLVTHVNLSTGTIWRTIYHFSGYLMGGGECDPNAGDPDCVEVDGF